VAAGSVREERGTHAEVEEEGEGEEEEVVVVVEIFSILNIETF
jgi:hypothetical protein